jgi:hypothetical protein
MWSSTSRQHGRGCSSETFAGELLVARGTAQLWLSRQLNDELSLGGLPMRKSVASGILHWKPKS